MVVHEPGPRDRRGADEDVFPVGDHLRACIHTAAARDAAREPVALLAFVLGHPRSGAQCVGSVDRDPRADSPVVGEEPVAVDHQVALDRELLHRLEADRLVQVPDQRRARLAHPAVHPHGADPTHFLEAVRRPCHRRRLPTLGVHGVLADLHQALDDVHVRIARHLERLPVGLGLGGILAPHHQAHGPLCQLPPAAGPRGRDLDVHVGLRRFGHGAS